MTGESGGFGKARLFNFCITCKYLSSLNGFLFTVLKRLLAAFGEKKN